MFQVQRHRVGHYLIILTAVALPNLANLGTPSLWDIDEGKNGEAAREMLESGNWVVPTFNYQVRFEKPALLYWLQIGAYKLCGIGEFAARLPSALACCLTALLAYELGRRMFDKGTGLLAGLILSSMALFCASAHFANPDALLNALSALTLTLFWLGVSSGHAGWLVPAGICAGLGVLAKGPVALMLPAAAALCFLAWSRQILFLRNRALLWAILAFLITALPWYVWIAVDTKGEFLRAFFLNENMERFLSPLEHHAGPPFYYLGVVLVGIAPWSIFIGPALWYSLGTTAVNGRPEGVRDRRRADSYRFLWCWLLVYLVFFSLARTKLPNYVLPAYLPLAVLIGRFLERWRVGALSPPSWVGTACLACLFVLGLGTTLVFLILGGLVPVRALGNNVLPGMEVWAVIGFIPMVGAPAAWCFWHKTKFQGMLACLTITSVFYVGALICGGSVSLDQHKAPRTLVAEAQARDEDHDIRIGAYRYFQPSLVFYCRREVECLSTDEAALEFLRQPLPVFLFVPRDVWASLKAKAGAPVKLLARHEDLYRRCEVVVVTNR
jgi:4-amino-4-deoxy-L-arabinose transferase-like glycosyltransferase